MLLLGTRLFHLVGNLAKVLLPRTTASPPDIDVRVAPRNLAHEPAEFLRIAFLQMPDSAIAPRCNNRSYLLMQTLRYIIKPFP